MSKTTEWEKNNKCFVYLQFLAHDTTKRRLYLVIILDQEKGQGGLEKGQGGRSTLSLY